MRIKGSLGSCCHSTLTLALYSLLGVAAQSHSAIASTFTVANCEDKGPGTLRDALVYAPSGSTVDVSQLRCSTISLDNGGIAFSQNDMTIIGPGSSALTIKPGLSTGTGLLLQTGAGLLTISGVALRKGLRYSPASGHVRRGCVYSRGSIKLSNADVYGCTVQAVGDHAEVAGGCISADGAVAIENSNIGSSEASMKGQTRPLYLDGPLTDNGGPTRTHPLLRGSPAINAANNSVPRAFDQRGSPHLRGRDSRQGIGAFEVDPDQIFANRFE